MVPVYSGGVGKRESAELLRFLGGAVLGSVWRVHSGHGGGLAEGEVFAEVDAFDVGVESELAGGAFVTDVAPEKAAAELRSARMALR